MTSMDYNNGFRLTLWAQIYPTSHIYFAKHMGNIYGLWADLLNFMARVIGFRICLFFFFLF